MRTWQGIWLIAKHELLNERRAILFSFLLVNYTTFMMIAVIHQSAPLNEYTVWVENFLFLTLMPMFGFTMNRTMMRVWSEDSYSFKLADMRRMPITSRQIAGSRLLQFTIFYTAGWLYFFTMIYLLVDWAGEMEFLAFLGFALIWYAYGIVIGSIYISFELGVSGKQYMYMTLVFMAFFGLVTLGLEAAQIGLMRKSALMMIEGEWWLPVVLLLAAVGLMWVIYTAIHRRIEQRSLFL